MNICLNLFLFLIKKAHTIKYFLLNSYLGIQSQKEFRKSEIKIQQTEIFTS